MSRKTIQEFRTFYRQTYGYQGEELEYWVRKAAAEPRNGIAYAPEVEVIRPGAPEWEKFWEEPCCR